ncbi:uncharacterized protein LOC118434153 [Folsomia candida]|uniref:uncharacterized protein LOC118434153 n=1 Tax=Folsomia candida TaxID=158441 RepID=UPI0016051EED|nr:uncharacterized protein LOC118434153 [Folsomia candida]
MLKKFSLKLAPSISDPVLDNRQLAAPWMKNWADAIKRVESISTRGCDFLGSRFAQELQNNGQCYQNLKDIRLTCEPSVAINFLTELTQTVTNLTLTMPLETRDLRDFENLIKKFASCLELLSFLISTKGLGEKSRFDLNLPCLARLKKLQFYFGFFKDIRNSNIGTYQGHTIKDVARFRLSFPPSRFGGDDLGIDYERHLPSIRGIIVKPKFWVGPAEFWDTYSDLFDSLLPKQEGRSCQTLQRLEIPTWGGEIGEGYLQAGRLPKVFPNVRNEWMNDLREMKND